MQVGFQCSFFLFIYPVRVKIGDNVRKKMFKLTFGFLRLCQEIYRPGTAISAASNMCIAVGGDQNKEFRGNASFLREKGPRGGIRIYIANVFSILTRKPKIISIRSNLIC